MDASLQFDWLSPYALPRDLPAFVGRSADIETLDRLVSDGARFLTLTGPAGIGKSRLAIEWASSHLAPGARTAFLPASHLQDAAFVATMIATVGAVDCWPDLPLDRLPPDLDLLIVIDGIDHYQQSRAGSRCRAATLPQSLFRDDLAPSAERERRTRAANRPDERRRRQAAPRAIGT